MIGIPRRTFLRSSALMCGGVALAACSPPPPLTGPTVVPTPLVRAPEPSPLSQAGASAGGAFPKVHGAWVTLVVEQMVYALAVEAGYFQKYGIDFDLSYINQSANGIAGIASHSLDMIISSGAAAVSAQSGGADMVVRWSFITKPPFQVMALPGIATINDLKGKKAVVGRVGSATDYFSWLALTESLGWDPGDLQYVTGGDQAGQVALLQSGQVQAMLAEPPVTLQAEDVGAHTVFDMATTDVPYVAGCTIVSREYLTAQRGTVLNVGKACIEAVHRWKTDPEFTQSVIQTYLKPTDPRFNQVGWEAFKEWFQDVPFVSRDGMLATIDQVAAQTPEAKNIDVDRTFDNSIVQELVDSGFIKQIYGA